MITEPFRAGQRTFFGCFLGSRQGFAELISKSRMRYGKLQKTANRDIRGNQTSPGQVNHDESTCISKKGK